MQKSDALDFNHQIKPPIGTAHLPSYVSAGSDGRNVVMPHLDRDKIVWSLEHIVKHGDTDIFPYPFEFEFMQERKGEIADALAGLNTATFRPLSSLDSLVPKSRHGFRVAHQLYPIDAVMLTAAVTSIGEQIEAVRGPANERAGFSYRFEPNDEFSMFSVNCRYGNWLVSQLYKTAFSDKNEYKFVIEADIADFYQRIYHHRLENCLLEAAGDITETRLIRSFMRDIRARQSFGIPVGGNAARLLAELVLTDVDKALSNQGYEFTRYVDDFRIFVKAGEDPYNILAFLADSLWSGEGLSLSSPKTRVIPFEKYRENLELYSGEDNAQADQSAAERLLHEIYESEDSEDKIEELSHIDLFGEISEEIEKEYWDIGKMRVLLRCMKLTLDVKAVEFIKINYLKLLPFAKEVVLLMEELKNEKLISFQDMEENLTDLILSPAARHLHVTRAWFLELFVRGVVEISSPQARRLDVLSHILDQRAVYRIRARRGEVHYFRAWKARINELSPWLQPAFIHSAACLPAEEYKTWLGNIKGNLGFPLPELFVDWARSRR